MRRGRKPSPGQGTVWAVADLEHGDYLCYWYAGPNDGRLVAQGRAVTAAAAVAWGRLRTTRVRVRTADACTYWAGSAPRPEGLNDTWPGPETTEAAHPSPLADPRLGTEEPIRSDQLAGAGTGASSC